MTDKTKLTRRQLQKVKTFRRRLEENLRSVFTNSLPLWSNGLLPTELRLKINLYTRLPRINNRSSPKLMKNQVGCCEVVPAPRVDMSGAAVLTQILLFGSAHSTCQHHRGLILPPHHFHSFYFIEECRN